MGQAGFRFMRAISELHGQGFVRWSKLRCEQKSAVRVEFRFAKMIMRGL